MRSTIVILAAATATLAGCDEPTPESTPVIGAAVSASAMAVASRPAELLGEAGASSGEEILSASKRDVNGPASVPFASFAHVVHAGVPYAIIPTHPPGPPQLKDWLVGKPKLVRIGKPTVTLGEVDEAQLPDEVLRLRGKPLRLMSPHGPACQGAIDGFAVIGRVAPHFGSVNAWTGRMTGNKLPAAEVAADAWDQSSYALAARVKATGCKDARWAHDASTVAPIVARGVTVKGAAADLAIAELRKLGDWAGLQRDYASAGYKGAHWDAAGTRPPAVTRWQLGSRSWLAVRANVNIDGCGGFTGFLLAIFELEGGRLALANAPPEMPMFAELASVIAVDDGAAFLYQVEMEERGLLRGASATLRRTSVDTWPYLDCDC